jgi:hypothetical protein
MKYLIPIKAWEEAFKRGREIERKQPQTPHEQYREFEKENLEAKRKSA